VLRVCLDLNVWFGAFLSERLGRTDTAAQFLVDSIRSGDSARGPVALVISWGMLNRLRDVLARHGVEADLADRLVQIIATYGREGPSLTLGGVGVLAIDDTEDRHVLETAIAANADLLATHNLDDFVGSDVEVLVPGRFLAAAHGGRKVLIAHTFDAAAWLRGVALPPQVEAYMTASGPRQG